MRLLIALLVKTTSIGLRGLSRFLGDLRYAFRTARLFRTPAKIATLTFFHRRRIRKARNSGRFAEVTQNWVALLSGLRYDHDWFSGNVERWSFAFSELQVSRILEIGSFQGLSTVFLLSQHPGAKIDTVDTWLGSDENSDWNALDVEAKFDTNLSPFKSRMQKYKMPSSEFFAGQLDRLDGYDLIYVDGDHQYPSAKADLVQAFSCLNAGGFLIFDDYLWSLSFGYEESPTRAFNEFYKDHRKDFSLIDVGYQIILRKE